MSEAERPAPDPSSANPSARVGVADRNMEGAIRAIRGRVSQGSGAGTAIATTVLPPPGQESDWQRIDRDRTVLDTMSSADAARFLIAVSPEFAFGRWHLLRNCNNGFEYDVWEPDDETTHDAGKEATDLFWDHLRGLYGDTNVILNRLFVQELDRGGLFAELVLDGSGRLGIDIATPDPSSVRFRPQNDPDYGQRWELGQLGAGNQFVSLAEEPNVRYIPFDPLPDSPYGNSPLRPAIFPAIFLLGLFRDLRRVVQQQGFPQRDVEIDYDLLVRSMPRKPGEAAGLPPTQDRINAWVEESIAEIGKAVDGIPPDGTIVHTSVYKIQMLKGAAGEGALAHVEAIIRSLERMLVRGTKSVPLLMAIMEGGGEANANRQWETFAKTVKVLQHPVENLLSEFLTYQLEVQGILARVVCRFAEVRPAEEYRDAQTEHQKLVNAQLSEDLGYRNRTEGSNYAIGQDPAVPDEEPRPREPGAPAAPSRPPSGDEADPSADRIRAMLGAAADRVYERLRDDGAVRFVPAGADFPLAPLPEAAPTTAADDRQAAADFDAAAGDGHAGLLDAEVTAED